MIIPTNDLINYDGTDWKDYLGQICLYEVFKDLVEEYISDPEVLTGLMKYIVWAYSLDSNKIVIRRDWEKNKKDIFKAAELPKSMEDEVVHLRVKINEETLLPNTTLLHTIKRWLNLQNDENFSVWAMLNDLISEMRLAANSPVRKSTGEIDYEAKRKCAESVLDLLKKKDEVEQKFIQNNEKLKEAYKDVSQANNTQQNNTMGIETILKERKN